VKIRPVLIKRLDGGDEKKAINISFRTVGLNLTTTSHSAKYGQDRIKSSPDHWIFSLAWFQTRIKE